jgi:nucleoside-diphosphate-sugar epimerase
MDVLVAGATGAIGIPLVRQLVDAGHAVYGLSQDPSRASRLVELEARPVVADATDREALLAAIKGLKAHAVIHELPALKRPPVRHKDMAATNRLRRMGTANLLEAARSLGARRFLTQSVIFGYGYRDHGSRVLTEDEPFAPPSRGTFERLLAAMRSAEEQTFTAEGIEGIALRYCLFYGPGPSTDALIDRLRRRRLPIPSGGGGTVSWIHVDDAAAATVAALDRGRAGHAYNVVDGEPVSWSDFLSALASAAGDPPPRTVSHWLFRLTPYTAAMMTSNLRASNAKGQSGAGLGAGAPYLSGGDRPTGPCARWSHPAGASRTRASAG